MFFVNLSQGRFDFSHQRVNTGVKDKTDGGKVRIFTDVLFLFLYLFHKYWSIFWCSLEAFKGLVSGGGNKWVFMRTFLLVNGVSGPRTLGNKSLKLVTGVFAGWKHLDTSLWEHDTQKEDMRACGRDCSHHSDQEAGSMAGTWGGKTSKGLHVSDRVFFFYC